MAVVLGVTQTELETGYYMVDLQKLLESKRKQDALQQLNSVFMSIATNERTMDDVEYKKLINGLNKTIGIKTADKFDREKFEQLRAMTNIGGNKAR